MRVLRLGLGEGRSVDLHPGVSVVTGLTDGERTALRRGFASIAHPEGVRVALEEVRDSLRIGRTPGPQRLASALAGVGLDTSDLGLPVGELARIAADWLDERRREAGWVVGAEVELAALEGPHEQEGPGAAEAGARADRAARATRAHALAVVRLDEHQMEVSGSRRPTADAPTLVAHLLGRLGAHRPARLAGAVPLVLHDVMTHLGEADAAHVLERASGLAGAVQLVVVDENPATRGWAATAGIRRAAVVHPVREVTAAPLA